MLSNKPIDILSRLTDIEIFLILTSVLYQRGLEIDIFECIDID